jgi:hypothetical protein
MPLTLRPSSHYGDDGHSDCRQRGKNFAHAGFLF